jgi:vancomycin permeability regulator SanA
MLDGPPPARGRWGRWRRGLLAGGVLGLVALIGLANVYVIRSTRDRRVASAADAPERPYAMVLGNRVFPGNIPCPELAARLATGRALYVAGRAQRIIVSGMVGSDPDYDEPAAMAAWLEARGVPAAAIVRDAGGYRTAASMADAAALGVRSLLVVTQSYHLPRALYLAGHAGIDAIGVPASDRGRSITHLYLREPMARAEIVLEVLLRGVRGR